MRLLFDLDSRALRTWAGAAVTGLTAKRRDRFPVEVKFSQGGSVVELPAGTTGILGIKTERGFSNAFLASALTMVKTGTGANAVYTFDLNLNTVAVATAFSADPASVATALEIEIVSGTIRRSSVAQTLTIANDYVRGDENAPESAPPTLSGWGNSAFRFGTTGEPEINNSGTWYRLTLSGTPPQITLTQI